MIQVKEVFIVLGQSRNGLARKGVLEAIRESGKRGSQGQEPGRDTMKDRKDGTEEQDSGEKITFVCPVCGKLLHERNLPDMHSIIYDNLYLQGGVRIGSPKVRFYCDFEHCFDEEGLTMDNPHDLLGVVDAEFGPAGDCTRFSLSDIRAAENVKSSGDPGIERRVK